jgi:xanthine dehydrogenase accessory factor
MLALTDLTEKLLDQLQDAPAVLVSVSRTQGSVPREAGAWMAVFAQGTTGTIGGGQLEAQAIDHARTLLHDPTLAAGVQRHALGPSLGQCCGGAVEVSFERIDRGQIDALRQRLQQDLPPVALFGGGHVGHAIVRLLVTLPYSILWIDSRDQVFAPNLPSRVHCEHSQPVQAAVDDLPPGSRVLIMSFSHAEDLDVVSRCLMRLRRSDDLPFVGLIGSATKWAVFRRRLLARGFTEAELARITCPIGLPGLAGKEPAVIAVAVAAQLLMQPRSANGR